MKELPDARPLQERPGQKDELIERAIEHRKADRILHDGEYFYKAPEDAVNPLNREPNGWRGCAIGCLATPVRNFRPRPKDQDKSAAALLRGFGIPRHLTLAAEAVFEGYAASERNDLWYRKWPERFARAIPVGVTLTNDEVREWLDTNSKFDWSRYRMDELVACARPKAAATDLTRWLRSLGRKTTSEKESH